MYTRKMPNWICLQDLLENAQYYLLLHTSSSTVLSDADITINKDQALLWQRTKNDANSFSEDYGYIEKMILENPMTVFYGSKLFTDWELKNFPCLIETTSNVLGKVFFRLIRFFNEYRIYSRISRGFLDNFLIKNWVGRGIKA